MKYKRKTPIKEDCPMELTLNLISGKWKPAIISALLKEKQRPKDLQKQCADASKRALAQQLRELEKDGLIAKTVYNEIPLKVEYYLTPLGKSLQSVVNELNDWGRKYQLPG